MGTLDQDEKLRAWKEHRDKPANRAENDGKKGAKTMEKNGSTITLTKKEAQIILANYRAKNDGKADAGKVRVCFPIDYFPRALEAVARICEDGEKEYGYGTWADVPDALRRYREADMRHRLAIAKGEKIDPKSGKPHSWHRAWNLLAIVELEERERE